LNRSYIIREARVVCGTTGEAPTPSQEFRIVGEDEADPSRLAPLARAVLTNGPGDRQDAGRRDAES
jgi:transcription elongation GreA/GreB family factor